MGRHLDRHLDVEFLTNLSISEVPGERKGQAETILLMMYGEIEGYPSVQSLIEHGAMKTYILPHLQHAYERTYWPERKCFMEPDNFFIFRCISKPLSLARLLVAGGAADLAGALVAQPETDESTDVLGLIWQGKTSA